MAATLICLVVLPTLPSAKPTGIPIAHPSCLLGLLDLVDDLGGGTQQRGWSRGIGKLTNSGNGPIERKEAPGLSGEAPAMESTKI